jgi:tRNA/rRNA methyltransferase
MGISRLRVVDPEDLDLERVMKMATHTAAHIIDEMEIFPNLAAALKPFQYVVGTTARTGGRREETRTPREMAEELVPICAKNQVALVFGTEPTGLTNPDLRHCHALVTIPTADFASLNLAQAVMVVCYELMLAGRVPVERSVPRMAKRRELDDMYEHLKKTFMKIGFAHPENPEHPLQHLRSFLSRIHLRARDVRVIRGMCRQIDWYIEKTWDEMSKRKKT